MPIYGEAKKRDICRSVLPSTKRKGARLDLQQIKQRNRSKVRRELRQIAQPQAADEVVANYDEASYDLNHYPYEDIRSAVYDRREGDKLGALTRWAPHLVEDVRREDRLSKLRSILPDNLIGRHAISHLEYHDDFYLPNSSRWYDWRSYPKLTDDEKAWVRAVEYAEIERRLKRVIERGLLARFNKLMHWHDRVRDGWVRETYNTQTHRHETQYSDHNRGYAWKPNWIQAARHRPLRGAHDICNFIKDAGSSRDYYTRNNVIEAALERLDI